MRQHKGSVTQDVAEVCATQDSTKIVHHKTAWRLVQHKTAPRTGLHLKQDLHLSGLCKPLPMDVVTDV